MGRTTLQVGLDPGPTDPLRCPSTSSAAGPSWQRLACPDGDEGVLVGVGVDSPQPYQHRTTPDRSEITPIGLLNLAPRSRGIYL